MHDQKLIKIQDITSRLQRAQLMLERAMEMNPKTDIAEELKEGRLAIAHRQVSNAICDIDDLDTQLRR